MDCHLGRSYAANERCWYGWVNHGLTHLQKDSARSTEATEGKDKGIIRPAHTDSYSSFLTIQRETETAITTKTIDRWLKRTGLNSRLTVHRLIFTCAHWQGQRFQAYLIWNPAVWSRITFSLLFALKWDPMTREHVSRNIQDSDRVLTWLFITIP